MRLTGLILISSLAFSSCSTSQGPQEQAGIIIGGALGGMLGTACRQPDGSWRMR